MTKLGHDVDTEGRMAVGQSGYRANDLAIDVKFVWKSEYRMKQINDWALNVAEMLGASYADARIGDDRSRALATKNGKIGGASDSESRGIGVRVLADGAWGYAASDDLSRASVEATAARAVEIARASAKVKQHDVRLAPEKPATAD